MKKITNSPKYAVVGGGCGGQAIAAYLASKGYDVSLYNRSEKRIDHVMNTGFIDLDGCLKGRGKLSYVGTDMKRALEGRDVIMVVTTADAHKGIAQKMSPYLRDNQIILLNPGRTCGALEVDYTLRKNGCKGKPVVGEANTLIYASRVMKPGVATIKGVKNEVSTAALRAKDTKKITSKINKVYPQFVPAETFLETSLGNIGAIFHPTITILNKDKIYGGQGFDYYVEGVTDEVAEYIDLVDKEFMEVSRKLDSRPLSVKEWLNSRYSIPLSETGKMMRENPVYQGIKDPGTLDHRYLWEDIPTGLVPISEFGKCLGVETPVTDFLIKEGSEILQRNFRVEGRIPETLGLSRDNLKEDIQRIIWPKIFKITQENYYPFGMDNYPLIGS
ncbi:MAG: NADP transhydrogenase subunit alpha [Candidatus Aenigmarchaeota archaeon]|nr:NADP transhydrogenase subunit alpha [Candidatus Aenigmarchaeota archaeon]